MMEHSGETSSFGDAVEPLGAETRFFATIGGKPIMEPPKDLYIPPEALEVFLETFQGPLDLLLYLIKKQNLDILDIPIAGITKQYMVYIEMMQEVKLELVAEYLLMAAMLAEIKSRMLLPQKTIEEEEGDPRAELVRRLQEYERYKKVAEEIEKLPRMDRDWHELVVDFEKLPSRKPPPAVQLEMVVKAFAEVMHRIDITSTHQIKREPLSVRDRMARVLSFSNAESFKPFHDFFRSEEGRAGAIVTFIAILELLKDSLIEIVDSEEGNQLYIKLAA
jgi:segregation and condensation protein A